MLGKIRSHLTLALAIVALGPAELQSQTAGSFTIEQVKSYPFPNELTASSSGSRLAWALNERGLRNVWVAEGPAFTARRLTNYTSDDGQELTSISITPDGKYVVYVRGGDHGGNWDESVAVNPTENPTGFKVQVWSVPFSGGEPKALAEGDEPAVSPRGDRVAFTKNHEIWISPIDGSTPAKKLFSARGNLGDLAWSPDGSRLAFVADRGDHAWIGVFSNDSTPFVWLAPSSGRDFSPRWSPDGKRIVFVRTTGRGGAPDSLLKQRDTPWSIWTAGAATGSARQLWAAPKNSRGSYPQTQGEANLHWAANGRIVFLADLDGWPHLYSIAENGGTPLLLTPGNYMAEYVQLSPDAHWLVFAANSGSDSNDVDRRHVVRVPVDRAAPQVMTPGSGLEWTPFVTGDGQSIAFIGATAQRPPVPAVMPMNGGSVKWIGLDRIPSDFPAARLVSPRKVVFKSSDGLPIHGQLFESRRTWQKTGGDFRPRWSAAPNAARLALLRLLLERVRGESAAGRRGLRGVVGELSIGNWLRPRIPPSTEIWNARCDRISGRKSWSRLSALITAGRSSAHWHLWGFLRRLFDGDGPGKKLRRLRSRSRHPRRS